MIRSISGANILIKEGDLTLEPVDALVNPANNRLLMGGGVAGALKRKAGNAVEAEAVAKGPITIGEAVATSAGNLNAKWIIHAATMGMDFKTDAGKISASTRNALKVADEIGAKTVAFPAMGTGVGRFPLGEAAQLMLMEMKRHLEAGSGIEEIRVVLFGAEALRAFEDALQKL